MAYGITCPKCGATVDNNEYDYARDMCRDCVIEEEMEERRRDDVRRIMNAPCEQMVLEV